MTVNVKRGSWPKLIVSGFAGGLVINAIEWTAHRIWLDEHWKRAFAALGKTPAFWGTFVVANFLVGVVSVWTYHWLSTFYGRGTRTAVKTAIGMWIVFWVIPVAGMQPFDIFPNYLLALVIIVGIADGLFGTLFAIWLFELMTEPK